MKKNGSSKENIRNKIILKTYKISHSNFKNDKQIKKNEDENSNIGKDIEKNKKEKKDNQKNIICYFGKKLGNKNLKFSEKSEYMSEKQEISKSIEISAIIIMIKTLKKIFFNHKEEENPKENKNSKNYTRKNKKLNKIEYENETNKKFIKMENYNSKIKLEKNDNINLKNNPKIYNISFYLIALNILLFSQLIKCNFKKIELSNSYIDLKTKGTGIINIFSEDFSVENYPTNIVINNIINYDYNETPNKYDFTDIENDINNIRLIWEEPPISACNMFKECDKIIEIDFSNFDSSRITTMENMFSQCFSLKSLNLSNLCTSKVTTLANMFDGCGEIISLDLSKFDTSGVLEMNSMFSYCQSLQFLNLSNFNTSIVTTMEYMFYGCKSLISLNLTNINTSSVSTMHSMFNGCTELISLDLSNFDTSSVTTMETMFNECSKLISLDLSNFNTSIVNKMGSMFNGCKSLRFLIYLILIHLVSQK